MITMAKNPSMAWLRVSNKKIEANVLDRSIWGEIGMGEVFTHRSWISLWLIVKWYGEQFQKEKPVIYVPEYYCYDTIFQMEDDAEVVYYPIKQSLEPDLKVCRQLAKDKKPDLFLFVHFFGKIFSINDTSVFCRQYNTVLIEDAVHVLVSRNKIGKLSDFILFSPWKLLGLPDGAILVIGKKNHFIDETQNIIEYFQKMQNEFPENNKYIQRWKWKKIFLKLIPHIKQNKTRLNIDYHKEDLFQISAYSKKILLQISLSELLEVGERRKEICMYIEEYCSRKYGVYPLLEPMEDIPYTAAIKVEEKAVRDQIDRDFQKIGRIVSRWPSLSPKIGSNSIAQVLAESVVTLAVHENIKLSMITKCFRDRWENLDSEITYKKITRDQYEKFCNEVQDIVPLLQSGIYGEVKEEIQGWISEYYIFFEGAQTVAGCMVLKKKCFPFIYRINQGVVWKIHPDEEMKYRIYNVLSNLFSGKGRVLFLASHEHRDKCNISIMLRNGFVYRNRYESTGYIDLTESKENIRNKLDSKWRNQLKSAEKLNLSVSESYEKEKLELLLRLHIKHKKDVNYSDSGDDISRELIRKEKIVAFYVQKESEEIIAFIMIALHGLGATYYIGWCNEQGYQYNLNKLLLWNAIMSLKDRGIHWFDMGGIDFIHTPGIAEFKTGTGCMYYETVGEFVKL